MVLFSPQYYEIHRYHEVKGISIPFMAIDLMGGVFSDLSLVFKAKFDVIAGVAYSLVVVCVFMTLYTVVEHLELCITGFGRLSHPRCGNS